MNPQMVFKEDFRAYCPYTEGGIWKRLSIFMKINIKTNGIIAMYSFSVENNCSIKPYCHQTCVYKMPVTGQLLYTENIADSTCRLSLSSLGKQ